MSLKMAGNTRTGAIKCIFYDFHTNGERFAHKIMWQFFEFDSECTSYHATSLWMYSKLKNNTKINTKKCINISFSKYEYKCRTSNNVSKNAYQEPALLCMYFHLEDA